MKIIEEFESPLTCPKCGEKGITKLIKKTRHEYFICSLCGAETKSTGRWIFNIGRNE